MIFYTWLPKLKGPAVVLFHDINVREHQFWRLEIVGGAMRKNSPHFSFSHGHGLGVIGVGSGFSEELNWLFEAGKDEGEQAVLARAYFR